MRIHTRLTDEDRDAVKEYAMNHGYTMKQAYTTLIRDALHDRFLMRLHPETGNVGVKFAGFNNSVMTNVPTERFFDRLEYHDGDWVCVYAPRQYALERAGVDVDRDPSFWLDQSDADPKDAAEGGDDA